MCLHFNRQIYCPKPNLYSQIRQDCQSFINVMTEIRAFKIEAPSAKTNYILLLPTFAMLSYQLKNEESLTFCIIENIRDRIFKTKRAKRRVQQMSRLVSIKLMYFDQLNFLQKQKQVIIIAISVKDGKVYRKAKRLLVIIQTAIITPIIITKVTTNNICFSIKIIFEYVLFFLFILKTLLKIYLIIPIKIALYNYKIYLVTINDTKCFYVHKNSKTKFIYCKVFMLIQNKQRIQNSYLKFAQTFDCF
ncbi:transmembrane protein, putative (macronuclear) [Tetrahymena thermophila SB210]|uniref:Transmembrane protein, putative n=1 Tax=Tetrahymena thermophila (strain SB210) TaxID=312017 RepID=W7XE76_TETTS|nr:transmembrane protein, putative [Tetrahymena thermophila SB210]EWS71169.1 transmembrane protein, putative [Tetrahymena thermophila SB210]|eukprot:XP_012656310.1 transmembrane protein, putative [Tetrahymena thermophila SB210]